MPGLPHSNRRATHIPLRTCGGALTGVDKRHLETGRASLRVRSHAPHAPLTETVSSGTTPTASTPPRSSAPGNWVTGWCWKKEGPRTENIRGPAQGRQDKQRAEGCGDRRTRPVPQLQALVRPSFSRGFRFRLDQNRCTGDRTLRPCGGQLAGSAIATHYKPHATPANTKKHTPA